jgi:hypothetical protein
MTNILTYDVQTYDRELISKEFGSGNNEEKAPSETSFNSYAARSSQAKILQHNSWRYYQ